MDRPDYFHDKPYTYIAKIFNMVQACRNDLSIIETKKEYVAEIDVEFVKVVDALHREVHRVFDNKEAT